MNVANRRSKQMTKTTFHLVAASRIHGLCSSRPRPSMNRSSTCASTLRVSTSTLSNVWVSSSWSLDHLPTDNDSATTMSIYVLGGRYLMSAGPAQPASVCGWMSQWCQRSA